MNRHARVLVTKFSVITRIGQSYSVRKPAAHSTGMGIQASSRGQPARSPVATGPWAAHTAGGRDLGLRSAVRQILHRLHPCEGLRLLADKTEGAESDSQGVNPHILSIPDKSKNTS